MRLGMNGLLIFAPLIVLFNAISPLYAEPQVAKHAASAIPESGTHTKTAMKKDPAFDDAQALKISQAAIGQSVDGFNLLDREGRNVVLEDYRGKPLVVSFIYTACFHTCPIITQTLKKTARVARDTFGEDSFQMLTIGFDTRRDSPEKMRTFARQQGVGGEPGWEFLSADKETMKRLSQRFGFLFYKSPSGFEHLAQTTVIDAKGVIRHQIYGQDFGSPQLVEPLKGIIFGGGIDQSLFSNLINRAKLWCTLYDPRTDSYRFQYGMVLGFAVSAVFLLGWGILLIRMWRKVLRYRRAPPTNVNSDG